MTELKKAKSMNFTSYVLNLIFMVGFGLLLVGGWTGFQKYQLVRKSVRTQGRVIEIKQEVIKNPEPHRRLMVSFHPVYEFSTLQGEVITFSISTGTDIPPYREGETVQILYDPQDPQNASLVTYSSLLLRTLVLTGIGVLMVSLSTLALFLFKKAN